MEGADCTQEAVSLHKSGQLCRVHTLLAGLQPAHIAGKAVQCCPDSAMQVHDVLHNKTSMIGLLENMCQWSHTDIASTVHATLER